MLTYFSISIKLLKYKASNSKLKYISFYINLFKRVKINKSKRLSKGGFKRFKTLFSIFSLLKGTSFLTIFYTN